MLCLVETQDLTSTLPLPCLAYCSLNLCLTQWSLPNILPYCLRGSKREGLGRKVWCKSRLGGVWISYVLRTPKIFNCNCCKTWFYKVWAIEGRWYIVMYTEVLFLFCFFWCSKIIFCILKVVGMLCKSILNPVRWILLASHCRQNKGMELIY